MSLIRVSRWTNPPAIVQAALHNELLNGHSAAIFHHLGLMRARIAALQAAFPESTLHAIAIKANPVVEILREVVRAGAGLEAASIEEVHLAVAAGCPAERVIFDSPAKTRAEIQQALRLGVQLNVDNFDELERVAAARAALETTSLIGLRVNPMVGGGSIAHTSVADVKSKFGVPLDANRRQIIAAFARHPWLHGFHIHVGSQGCSLKLLVEAAGRIVELRQQIVVETGNRVDASGYRRRVVDGLSHRRNGAYAWRISRADGNTRARVVCRRRSAGDGVRPCNPCELRDRRVTSGVREAGAADGGDPPGGRFFAASRVSAGRLAA